MQQKTKTDSPRPLLLVGASPLELRASPIALVALWQVVELRQQIDREENRLVQIARAGDVSWSDIGAALGVSAQAAQQRFVGRARDRFSDGSAKSPAVR